MIPTTDPTKRAQAERIAADVEAFLAAGGTVKRLGPGEFGFDALTNKQRINPTVISGERKARKAALEALPTPRKPDRVKLPKAPKPPAAPKFCPPGSQKARILEALKAGPLSAKFLAGMLGTSRQVANQQLTELRSRGMVKSVGRDRLRMVWMVCR